MKCNVKVVHDETEGLWKVFSTRGNKNPEEIFSSRFPVTLRWNGEVGYQPSIEPSVPTIPHLVRTFVMNYLRGKPGGIQINKKLLNDVLLYGRMYKFLFYLDKVPATLGVLPSQPIEATLMLADALQNQIETRQAFWREHSGNTSAQHNFNLKEFYNNDKDYVEKDGESSNKDKEQSTPIGRANPECEDDNPLLSGHSEDEHETGLDLLLGNL
jgi:hypothetical protein